MPAEQVESTEIRPTRYQYRIVLKLTELGDILNVPGVTGGSITSRVFENLTDSVVSSRHTLQALADKCNENGSELETLVEVNPVYGGESKLSSDWQNLEVARVWLYDQRDLIVGNLNALAMATIEQLHEDLPTYH